MNESYVLDPTEYEIGSILTEVDAGHVRGFERRDILDLTKEIEKVIARIKVIKLESLNISDIMELALTAGLTFYDP